MFLRKITTYTNLLCWSSEILFSVKKAPHQIRQCHYLTLCGGPPMCSHQNHSQTIKRHWYVLFFFSEQTPFMSALSLQCPSFFRRRRCQGSRMAASPWWETVAHVPGWLPSFGIIGKRRGKEERGGGERRRRKGGGFRKGALSTLWDSGICCGNDLHRFSPLFLTLPPSHCLCLFMLGIRRPSWGEPTETRCHWRTVITAQH